MCPRCPTSFSNSVEDKENVSVIDKSLEVGVDALLNQEIDFNHRSPSSSFPSTPETIIAKSKLTHQRQITRSRKTNCTSRQLHASLLSPMVSQILLLATRYFSLKADGLLRTPVNSGQDGSHFDTTPVTTKGSLEASLHPESPPTTVIRRSRRCKLADASNLPPPTLKYNLRRKAADRNFVPSRSRGASPTTPITKISRKRSESGIAKSTVSNAPNVSQNYRLLLFNIIII